MYWLRIITTFFKWCFNYLPGIIIFTSCTNSEHHSTRLPDAVNKRTHLRSVKYAKHFGIIEKEGKKIIFVTENYRDSSYFEVHRPYSRLAVLGTIPAFQISLLKATTSIVAIDDVKYYNNRTLCQLYDSGYIVEVLPNLQWNYEKLLFSKPEVIISYSKPNENAKLQQLLHQNGIQYLQYLDYLEPTPLGRSEWIKVMGCLLNKEKEADSIFNSIEENYHRLRKIRDTISRFPKVITEVMMGDVWYIAGNLSYIAQIIRDAGGNYVFDFHSYENSRPYSFEYVLKHGQSADVWIHLHQFRTLEDMRQANGKYTLFKAFQNKRCYNNNRIVNKYGYSDYYESGICLPYLLLKDMINILHSANLANDSLHYYYRLSDR